MPEPIEIRRHLEARWIGGWRQPVRNLVDIGAVMQSVVTLHDATRRTANRKHECPSKDHEQRGREQ